MTPGPARDAEMIRLRALGRTWEFIATAIGMCSGAAACSRFGRMQTRRVDPEPRHIPKIRQCGRCGVPFASQHAGVRRCDPCRDVSLSPFEPDGCSGSPGVHDSIVEAAVLRQIGP